MEVSAFCSCSSASSLKITTTLCTVPHNSTPRINAPQHVDFVRAVGDEHRESCHCLLEVFAQDLYTLCPFDLLEVVVVGLHADLLQWWWHEQIPNGGDYRPISPRQHNGVVHSQRSV